MFIINAPYPDAEHTVYLPSPSLGDIRRLTHGIMIKRNLAQNVITYVKKNNSEQFDWQFLISMAKMWELYYFLREYKEFQMQVVDHRDRCLVGYLLNATDAFTHERRGDFPSDLYDLLGPGETLATEELVSINLSFVGNFQ